MYKIIPTERFNSDVKYYVKKKHYKRIGDDIRKITDELQKGIGKAMLTELARIAEDRGCGRLEWWCLDWNEPSIEFYKSMVAEPMNEWTVYRIAGDTLQELGQ